jgi:hypothetical protein
MRLVNAVDNLPKYIRGAISNALGVPNKDR